MSSASWTRIEDAFATALEHEGDARATFLAALRDRDPTCADEVERLLEADAHPYELLDDATGARSELVHEWSEASGDLRTRLDHALGDRYTLTGELGQGGMAVVYAGVERKHARQVAIKVMRPQIAGRIGRRRFEVEIRLMAQLAHPHIVPLYDSGEADGLLYYVTAAVPGETLAARIAREGALPLDAVRDVTRGIAAALGHAHRRRIVHRDVKPSNILLQGRLALLTDFGIGKVLADPDVDLTGPDASIGTPRYMSPEQLRSTADVDFRSDLYSLGLVVYEMLTGRPAAAGDTAYSIIAERVEASPPAPSSLRPDLPPGVDAVLFRALDPDPSARYESVRAFRDALDAALDGAPAPPHRAASVAVLPLDNRAPGGDDAYLSEGISEQLIHQLATVPGLRVVARASSFALATEAPAAIGQTLGVDHLLTGSLQRQGDRLRIHADLVETDTGYSAWSETYDRQLDDVFAVQDEIVESIASTLRERLGTRVLAPPKSEPVVPDVHAYQYYLRARHDIFSFTEVGLRRALGYLDQGLGLLPDNVSLLAAKGYAHWQLVNAGIDPNPAHLDQTHALAEQIETLAPESAHAHRLFGLAAFHRGRMDEAIDHLERALSAEPTDADAALWLTLLLGFRGQPHRVEPHVAMLLETDPLNPLHQMLPGFLALMRGQTSAAPNAFRAALALDPDNPVIRLGCGQAEAMAGEHEAALDTLRPLDGLPPGTLFAGLGRLLRRGLGEDVPALTETEAAASATDLQWAWTAAQGHALAGELDEAARWMERAVELGFVNYPLVALYDPLLRPLRGHPAYEALLRQLDDAWAAQLPQPAFREPT